MNMKNIFSIFDSKQPFFGDFWFFLGTKSEISHLVSLGKEGCVFPMVIRSEFCMRRYRIDDHEEDAPHFSNLIMIVN